jgi:hypothetical protein
MKLPDVESASDTSIIQTPWTIEETGHSLGGAGVGAMYTCSASGMVLGLRKSPLMLER